MPEEEKTLSLPYLNEDNTEPFRLWLAQVGEERFEEIEDPEKALDRVRAT